MPWWCTATISNPAPNSGAAYTGAVKGDLVDADCRWNAVAFDGTLNRVDFWGLGTVGGASSAGFIELTGYETGVGTSMVAIDPADLTDPGFDPDNPVFTAVDANRGVDGHFEQAYPEVLHYAGSGPGAQLVGVGWMVETDPVSPPAGFMGDNDWWHREVQDRCLDTLSGGQLGLGLSDVDCANLDGVNVDFSSFWMLNAWIQPDFRFQSDVFNQTNPCLGAGGADTDPESTCRVTDNAEVIRVLVTNDDGIQSEGLDVLVESLRELPDVEIFVYAPATQQSGSGDGFTPGGPPAPTPATTLSGYPAWAVAGEPADAVVAATVHLTKVPDLVISGINEGNNGGTLSNISGTVGAAKTAARYGIPALATSQQDFVAGAHAGTHPDYENGVEHVIDWLADNRDGVLAGAFGGGAPGDPTVVTIMDQPTCPTGSVRGVQVGLPLATDFANGNPFLVQDCTSTVTVFADDMDALTKGMVTVGNVPSNDTPIATADDDATDSATTLNVVAPGVLGNDLDGPQTPSHPGGPDLLDSWGVTAFDAVSTEGATVSVALDGSWQYDPSTSASIQALATGVTLDDTFTYTVTDSFGASGGGTVTVTVTGV